MQVERLTTVEDKLVVSEQMDRKMCSCLSHFRKEVRNTLKEMREDIATVKAAILNPDTSFDNVGNSSKATSVALPLKSVKEFKAFDEELNIRQHRDNFVSKNLYTLISFNL